MNYTLDELEEISLVKENSGYKNILKALAEEISYTEEEMESMEGNLDVKLLPYWKALKKVVFILTSYPETIRQELENYRKLVLQNGMEDIFMRKPSHEQLKALKSLYETMKHQKK